MISGVICSTKLHLKLPNYAQHSNNKFKTVLNKGFFAGTFENSSIVLSSDLEKTSEMFVIALTKQP